MEKPLNQPPQELILLVEWTQVGAYAIQRAVDLAHTLGAELRVRLLRDRHAERAARLPPTRLIGLESGRRGSFNQQTVEDQLKRAAAELDRHLQREARRRGVACRLELTAEDEPAPGTRWVLLGHAAALRRIRPPATETDVFLIFHPPRNRKVQPVTAVVCLAAPGAAQLQRVAAVAFTCGFHDPLLVFTSQAFRRQREISCPVPLPAFQILPSKPLTAPELLRWLDLHGASSALIVLPQELPTAWDVWAEQLASLSEIPLAFLREPGAE